MKDKIKKKIIRHIVFATLLFVVIISLLTGFFIMRNDVISYEENAKQSIKLATSYSNIKLDNIKNDTYRLTHSQTIIDGLNSEKYSISINPKLNFIRSQFQEEVESLVLYSMVDDFIYKTDSISYFATVPLNLLEDKYGLSHFINGDTSTTFFIQHQQQVISQFSFMHKVMDGDRAIGYLLINIKPSYMLTHFFSYDHLSTINLKQQYIVKGTEKLYFNDEEASDVIDNPGFSDKDTYVVKGDFYIDDYAIYTMISTEPLINHMIQLLFVIILIDLISLFVAYISARRLGINVANRFNELKMKMISAPDIIR